MMYTETPSQPKPESESNQLPREMKDKLANLGDKLVALSEKEVTKRDAIMTMATITTLSVLIGSYIKKGQSDALLEYFNESLANRFADLDGHQSAEKTNYYAQEMIAISTSILVSSLVWYLGSKSKFLFPTQTSLDKPMMPVSTHVLPKMGKILQKFRE